MSSDSSSSKALCVSPLPIAHHSSSHTCRALRKQPPYYRHLPGSVPNFFTGLFRRRLVVWWMVAEVLRDFWLSPVYGRNQAFLWSSREVPVWTTFVEVIVFFVVIWAVSRFFSRERERYQS